MIYDMMYLLTAVGLTPGGSSTVHIYTQTVHGTTQLTTRRQLTEKHNNKNNTINKRTTQLTTRTTQLTTRITQVTEQHN